MKLAIATCKVLPEPDVDAALVLEAFTQGGFEVEFAAWDDSDVGWAKYDACLLRSTWNYYEDIETFRSWISSTSKLTKLINSEEVVLANLHKSYLLLLQELGIPIVPTRFVQKGESFEIGTCEWAKVVIKPAVAAGSFMTKMFGEEALGDAQTFLDQMVLERDAMIQPYLESVTQGGEIAIVTIAGEITHAVIKNARFANSEESVSEAVQPDPDQRALAELVLEKLESEVAYARIDLIKSDDGNWLLSELEQVEPSLFFLQNPTALQKLVISVRSLCRSSEEHPANFSSAG